MSILSTLVIIVLSLFALYSFISLGTVYLLAVNTDNLDKHCSGIVRPDDTDNPLVSVIIPCRNESDGIRQCIASVLEQSYRSIEIIVVDGNSDDGTWEIIGEFGDRIQAIREEEKPEGWTGKNWAAYLGYKRSRGSILLFLDGDMVLGRDAVLRSMDSMQTERIDLLSLGPEMEMKSFWERLILPLFAQFIMLLYMPPLMNRDRGRRSMANGQFLMCRREAYEKSGTHEAIKTKIVEDVNLSRKFRENGYRIRFYWASQYLRTRMYRDLGEMWEGLVRDIQGETGRRYHLYLLNMLYIIFTFYFPVWAVIYFSVAGNVLLTLIAAVSIVFVLLRMLVFQVGTGSPNWLALIFPFSTTIYLAMVAAAFARALTGTPVVWKKRHYPMSYVRK
ncbi:MAG: glycosyltransferase [Thermoplasmata archaeon YP2-bin.285]|uniref:Glycosyltransferase n=1 Tax=Candidatus Sysuiplasma superficiale TaxID=2823368 RepID=A0A8J7YIX1_9ARCH|nr:glycosyltransferase [Candidatus Sysuiplasma superficiale]